MPTPHDAGIPSNDIATLQARLAAAKAREAALAEVLATINASPGDPLPVFRTILAKAHALCGAEVGSLGLFDGTSFRKVARHGYSAEADDFLSRPYPVQPQHMPLLRGAALHFPDVLDVRWESENARRFMEQAGMRAWLEVPLFKDGTLLGAISGWRRQPGPFTDQQIALLESFAAQAVIAIENARLLAEKQEALERQTATAEVLAVINANPGNLAPVFDTILDRAMRLCGIAFGILHTRDGTKRRSVAARGLPPKFADFVARHRETADLPFQARYVVETGRTCPIPDAAEGEGYLQGHLTARALVDLGGARATLLVPLLAGQDVVGYFAFYRQEVRAFSDSEIDLLESFAAQAVVAIENARLLTEQQEALDRQTATAEVLAVINANPGNLAPVFEALLEKAMRLCDAAFGELHDFDGERFRPIAVRGVPAEYAAYRMTHPPVPTAGNFASLMLAGERVIHIEDLADTDAYRNNALGRRAMVDLGGARAVVCVPLLTDSAIRGAIVIYRQEPRPFLDKQIAVLENFAAQAVIAMENARLLSELQARDEDNRRLIARQSASIDILKAISASPDDPQPVFDMIARHALELCASAVGGVAEFDGTLIHLRALVGLDPETSNAVFCTWPRPLGPNSIYGRAILAGHPTQIRDITAEETVNAFNQELAHRFGYRSLLGVPLLRDGRAIGSIAMTRAAAGGFADDDVALIESFAEQAVIAISGAQALRELRARDEDNRRLIARQLASIDILKAISASPDDPQPVFDMITRHALELCDSAVGGIAEFDGTLIHLRSLIGLTPDTTQAVWRTWPRPPGPDTTHGRVVLAGASIHVPDITVDQTISANNQDLARRFGYRAMLGVPLLRDGRVVGSISMTRNEAGGFANDEIALVESFAEQAVIAITGAQALRELRARTADLQESLDYQTAISDVLKVIGQSAFDLQPVLDIVVTTAARLCGADMASTSIREAEALVHRAASGARPEWTAHVLGRRVPVDRGTVTGRAMLERRIIQVADVRSDPEFSGVDAWTLEDLRTILSVPLLRDDEVVGAITMGRRRVEPFGDRQIELVRTFAAQAVIAMENVRLLGELRARTDELAQREDELRVIFENMGGGVAMFDATRRLVAWNRKFQDILDLPDDALAQGLGYADYIRTLAARGEFGPDADAESQVQRLAAGLGQQRSFERLRPNGHTVEVRNNPVADGGFVLIYADITERKRAEAEIAAARDAAEQAARTIDAAYRELKIAQANLIQAEKMASLGQLTAGIAHEIKNPLNFVNNFSDLSVELLGELTEAIAPAVATLDNTARADVDDLTATLTGNLRKITEHGRRADGIVRSMLEHSRGSSGERRTVDLNAVVEEALNLAYHGARAQDQSFNITLERHYAATMAPITLTPQDITRVFLNLFSNGFYAANKRAEADGDPGFAPKLTVTTRDLGDAVEIRVRDNGTGVPPDVREKLFDPFFTTKPTGEGTGLGLSISYDIVTKQHGGSIAVDSAPDVFTEFTVILPRRGMAA